jgi:hypothetical protein
VRITPSRRPRAAVSGNEDELLLAINVRGCSIAHQGDWELRLENGDAVVATRGSGGFGIVRPTPVRFIGFCLPRGIIAPLVGGLDDSTIRIVPHGTEALGLLVVYAGAIAGGRRLHTPELRRFAVTHDLIAATVATMRDGLAIAEGRGIRAARPRAIMADITANLTNCDLTAVARRQSRLSLALGGDALRDQARGKTGRFASLI